MPRNWTRNELLIAMNLYGRLPFGLFHAKQPLIIEVAEKMGRTPGSVAMKLCNLASFDPQLQKRGIKGLKAASRLDRDVWESFESDWETMGLESEQRYAELMQTLEPAIEEGRETWTVREGPTDARREVTLRRGQDFFRRAVMVSYHQRCCITGNPIPELLTASHIVGWAENRKERLNPRNGLCLAKTQDAAFDRHLITLDGDLRLVISRSLRDHFDRETMRENFARFEGNPIELPERFTPDPRFLEQHRDIFSKAG